MTTQKCVALVEKNFDRFCFCESERIHDTLHLADRNALASIELAVKSPAIYTDCFRKCFHRQTLLYHSTFQFQYVHFLPSFLFDATHFCVVRIIHPFCCKVNTIDAFVHTIYILFTFDCCIIANYGL